jgi:hypothetical protein
MAIKKCIAMRLGVIYDSQVTNRKQGGIPVRAQPPPKQSYWSHGSHIWLTAAGWNTQNYHIQVEALTFWLKNRLKQHVFYKNLYQDIILKHFVRNRSRIKTFFTSGHSKLFVQSFGSNICPQPSGLGLITKFTSWCEIKYYGLLADHG